MDEETIKVRKHKHIFNMRHDGYGSSIASEAVYFSGKDKVVEFRLNCPHRDGIPAQFIMHVPLAFLKDILEEIDE